MPYQIEFWNKEIGVLSFTFQIAQEDKVLQELPRWYLRQKEPEKRKEQKKLQKQEQTPVSKITIDDTRTIEK